jgi:protein-disulfide isomerase-like protein with CxxC motif
MTITVTEYTDPCCSWAWGTEPKLRKFRWQFADRMQWRTVMGGLVDDASGNWVGVTTEVAASKLAHYWSKVTAVTTMPYPVRLQWPPLTSNAMGQAVCAARLQGDKPAAALLRRLREGVFVLGVPGDTWERILQLAVTVPELEFERFETDLRGEAAAAWWDSEWQETRRPNEFARTLTGDRMGLGEAKPDGEHLRYAFATLVITGPDGEATVPGWRDEFEYLEAFEAAEVGITAQPLALPTADEALAMYGVLAPAELEALTGAETAPTDALSFDWGAGEIHVRADVAEVWRKAGWWHGGSSSAAS